MLTILQVLTGLLIIPMMCLGLMAGFSGGGNIPAFQQIGGWMLVIAPIASIIGIVASVVLRQMQHQNVAYFVISMALLLNIFLIVWLQIKTNFFW